MNNEPFILGHFPGWISKNVIITPGHRVTFKKVYNSYCSYSLANDKIPYSELDFGFYFLSYFAPNFLYGEITVVNTGDNIVFEN